MRKLRLLIVDESVLIRRDLSSALSREPSVEVVGSAPTGRTALVKIPILKPDVLVIDIALSEVEGFDVVAAVHDAYPRLTIIVLNTSSKSSIAASVDALTRGASGYVIKPDSRSPDEAAMRTIAEELVARLGQCVTAQYADHTGPPRPRRPAPPRTDGRIDVVAIGVSTGGPQALMEIVPLLPADLPVPVLIVQHMPPMFTKMLAARLATSAKLPVDEAMLYQPLAPGHIWIAPGDFHMMVERDGEEVRIVTHRGSAENSCRPSVDVLFRSVAEVYGQHALAVVMTGMGQDGLRGCEKIHAAGGQVIVQDQASSVVWGMPGIVARAGVADSIVALSGLANEIVDRVYRARYGERSVV